MAKIVIIGDVGGFADHLRAAIQPVISEPDTVVIQVGDLVDRGPDSSGVLALVRERMDAAPRRWIQLIGNHESQYVGGSSFWPVALTDDDAHLLRTWWLTDRIRVAVAVRAESGEEFLISHAGLSVDAWRELGGPVTATTAADLLNTRPEPLIWDDDYGPLWAEAEPTVYGPWLRAVEPTPFGQIHGHSTIVDFRSQTWRCGERVRQRSTVDWTARHTFTRIGTHRFVGVDPKHGRTGAPCWSPLVLENAHILG